MLPLLFYIFLGVIIMATSIKKAVINGKTVDIISLDEYERLTQLPNPVYQNICVEEGDYIYPITKTYHPDQVSVTSTNCITVFRDPETPEEKEMYSKSKVIDFSDVKGLRENILVSERLKSAEEAKLLTVNNLLVLDIPDSNCAELKAIKQAINEKHIDAESYKQRFPSDSDYNNDMRALKNPELDNISFFKAKRVLSAFDLDMFLTVKDKPGAVNPIGRTIFVKLTGD